MNYSLNKKKIKNFIKESIKENSLSHYVCLLIDQLESPDFDGLTNYIASTNNIQVYFPSSKIIVAFEGVSGSGKTYTMNFVKKQLEKYELKVVVPQIGNDPITDELVRVAIKNGFYLYDLYIDSLTWLIRLARKIDFVTKSIDVLLIDRYKITFLLTQCFLVDSVSSSIPAPYSYERIRMNSNLFNQYWYQLNALLSPLPLSDFSIFLYISKDTLKKRLFARNRNNDSLLLQNINSLYLLNDYMYSNFLMNKDKYSKLFLIEDNFNFEKNIFKLCEHIYYEQKSLSKSCIRSN